MTFVFKIHKVRGKFDSTTFGITYVESWIAPLFGWSSSVSKGKVFIVEPFLRKVKAQSNRPQK
jgi:hypothetical protein